jgi:CRISPR/Cas system-associated exonuclease Cas4 (RecB family)
MKPITAEELKQDLDTFYNSRIRESGQNSNRASNMGACARYIVYNRTKSNLQTLPDIGLQRIFEEGNYQEENVITTLRSAGFRVYRNQRTIDKEDLKAVNITGRTDLEIEKPGFEPALLEVKSMSPNLFDSINSLADLEKKSWHRRYIPQIQLYMYGTGYKQAILFIKCKSTNQEKLFDVNLDTKAIVKLIKKAKMINDHIEKGTLPPRTKLTDECEKCSYKHICCPDMHFTGVQLLEEYEEIQDILEAWFELKESKKRYDELDNKKNFYFKQLKEDTEKVLFPGFEVKISRWDIAGGEYTRQPGKGFRATVKKLEV